MSKQLPIQLSIPKPCSENWDEMTPAEQGRFCNHCQKTVIDFTAWNDKDLYQFFAKTEAPVCGRFFTGQLNRNISLPPQPPTRLYRIAIALGLTLLFTQVPNGSAHAQAPLVSENVLGGVVEEKKEDSASGDTIEINGTVYEASKQPAINAVITLSNKDGKMIGNAVTDFDGNFSIKPISKSEEGLELKVQYAGHYSVMLSFKNNSSIEIYLKARDSRSFTTGVIIQWRPFDPPGKTTIRGNDIKHMGY